MHILLLTIMMLQSTSYNTAPLVLTPPKTTIKDNTVTIAFTSPLYLPARSKFSLEILNANGEQINYSSDIQASKYTLTTHTVQPLPAQFIIRYFVVHDDNLTEESNTFIYNQDNQPTPPTTFSNYINIAVGCIIILAIIGLLINARNRKRPTPTNIQYRG